MKGNLNKDLKLNSAMDLPSTFKVTLWPLWTFLIFHEFDNNKKGQQNQNVFSWGTKVNISYDNKHKKKTHNIKYIL